MRKSVQGSHAPGTRKRVIRSAHPGVVLLPPDLKHNHPTWRARYVDPDSGRSKEERLDPLALRTAEARRDWAIRKARALAKRAMEIESGAPRATGTGLEDALKRYWEDHSQLRPRTLQIYRGAAAKLQAWAKTTGIRSADDITGPRLVAFRAELARETRTVHALGGKRGSQRSTGEARQPSTVNVELRAVRTILGYLRKLGLLARTSTDDLSDGLEPLAVSHDRGVYLKPPELRALLEAAIEHDADTFAATREEHAGLRPLGSTQRYQPIAPLIACALVTGMRFGEVASLTWSQVDLEALGDDGAAVGEIHLTATTKTKTRTVNRSRRLPCPARLIGRHA